MQQWWHKKRLTVYLLPRAALLLLSGCGYHWYPLLSNQERPTLSVPYAIGDDDGTLTAAVIQTLTASGIAHVKQTEATYRLQIALLSTQNQTVGYRYDKQKVSGEIKKNIVGTEGRRTIVAEVTLFEVATDQIAAGPYKITAEADYDYVDGDSIQDLAFTNSFGEFVTVLPFSLGQLESVEAAQEATNKPLYGKLAQKIADTLFSSWY